MDYLLDLKRQVILGEERLERTRLRLDELQQQLQREREQRLADEERSHQAQIENQLLGQIAKHCVSGAEQHLLTLLKAEDLLEVEGDRISVKVKNQYGLPETVSLQVGLPRLIQQQFSHFVVEQEDAIAPNGIASAQKESSSPRAEEIAEMTDEELLQVMESPQKLAELCEDFR
ncbi:MAG TPA: hypothetical protein V6D14_17580 [Coleofasciculaceae cyanobacterium]|jgi:hypothetical protein